jgi:signal transduction histidine kinase
VWEGFLRGIELQRLRKDGTLIDIALWITVLKDADGRVTDTFGIVEDITDRKRVEEALHLSERALRRALREREQLARNLHDNIIQSIYAIGFTLEECQRLAQEVPADANRKLDQVIAALNRVIREVRGYIVAPVEESETLSSDELMASLQRLGGLMENANSMRFSLTLDPAAAGTLTADQRAQLLYVAQEAMSNSLRHSGAATARVSLACTTSGVRLEILDDGVGFALPRMRNGNGGLKNIRLRARKIGANLDITSQPMGGTVISMEIPTNGNYGNARKV